MEIQWKAEATGYLLFGPYLGNIKILWGINAIGTSTDITIPLPVTVSKFFITLAGDRSLTDGSVSILGSIPSENSTIKVLRNPIGYVGADDCAYLVIAR